MTTEYLYQREVDRVLAALMPQNQLIVRVMLQTGMRLSDALRMPSEGLVGSGWYTEGKTGKKRRYGLPRPLLEAIRAQAGAEWAFPGRKPGTHKTRQAVWADIKRASRAFRLKQNVGAHSMRKVYAVRLMAKYGDLEKVRRNLNHSSSSITCCSYIGPSCGWILGILFSSSRNSYSSSFSSSSLHLPCFRNLACRASSSSSIAWSSGDRTSCFASSCSS